MTERKLRSVQEIFSGEFRDARTALVQRIARSKRNLLNFRDNFTGDWPSISEDFDMLVLAVDHPTKERTRQLWAGYFRSIQPRKGGKFRFYVDRFVLVGIHDRSIHSDAKFYSNGGGGGPRIKIRQLRKDRLGLPNPPPPGVMEQRLTWVRKNHKAFRDPVWRHWEGRCAVSNFECNELLVASHIYPWARSTPKEKTDFHNGLLLSAPLDTLFDYGYIGFSDEGKMLIKEELTEETLEVFGLSKLNAQISQVKKISAQMRRYLARHRKLYEFEH